MWFDCVERKRRAKLPLFTTAPRAFAAAPSFQACLRAFICTFWMCVYIWIGPAPVQISGMLSGRRAVVIA